MTHLTAPLDHTTAVNRRNSRNADLVQEYFTTTLRPAEVMIFVKYRDEIAGRRVLDIGCGAGSITRYLGRWTPHSRGIDFDEALIDHCRQTLPHIPFSVCDVYDLSQFPDGSFDAAIYGLNGFDTLGHRDRLAALAGVRRILSNKGLYFFCSHNRRHRHTHLRPRLGFSLNPATFALGTLRFARSVVNHSKLKPLEREEVEYALINDIAHDFCLLHYYIDRERQAAQLADVGFVLMEVYGEDGRVLQPGDDDSLHSTLYYVARCA